MSHCSASFHHPYHTQSSDCLPTENFPAAVELNYIRAMIQEWSWNVLMVIDSQWWIVYVCLCINKCIVCRIYVTCVICKVDVSVAVIIYSGIEVGDWSFGSSFRMIMAYALPKMIKNFPLGWVQSMGKAQGRTLCQPWVWFALCYHGYHCCCVLWGMSLKWRDNFASADLRVEQWE
jgi:hypothetical protein